MHWKCVRGLVQLGQDLYKIDYAHSFQRAIRSEAGSRPFPLYLNGADSPPLKNHPCFVRPEARQNRKKQSSRICGRLQHWRAGDSTKEQVRLPAVGAGSSINRLTNCWYTGSLLMRCHQPHKKGTGERAPTIPPAFADQQDRQPGLLPGATPVDHHRKQDLLSRRRQPSQGKPAPLLERIPF
jgi:hypothetical protein